MFPKITASVNTSNILILIVILGTANCSLDICTPNQYIILSPTEEDVAVLKMYKTGSIHRFLLNSKNTLSFIASEVNYYEGYQDNMDQIKCYEHYVS